MYVLHYQFRVLLAGEKNVGKSTLTYRYMTGSFIKDLKRTIGLNIISKNIEYDGKRVNIIIYDFGGEMRFRSLLPKFCLGAHGAFLLYDCTNEESFNRLEDWLTIVRNNTNDIPIILLGTKIDKINQRVISFEQGNAVREKFNLPSFLEISSKTGKNVDRAIEKMVELLFERIRNIKV
ncbi:MAG: Rab family GTPase [Promethearchaeota archaeon]